MLFIVSLWFVVKVVFFFSCSFYLRIRYLVSWILERMSQSR